MGEVEGVNLGDSVLAQRFVAQTGRTDNLFNVTLKLPHAALESLKPQVASFGNAMLQTQTVGDEIHHIAKNNQAFSRFGHDDGLHFSSIEGKSGQLRVEHITDTVLPTLQGTIGGVVHLYDGQALGQADVDITVHGRYKVVQAERGEDLGPNGFRLDHVLTTDVRMASDPRVPPLKAHGKALWVEKDKQFPNLSFDRHDTGTIDEALDAVDSASRAIDSMSKKVFSPSGDDGRNLKVRVPEHDPFLYSEMESRGAQYNGPAGSLFDGKIIFTGAYHVSGTANVEMETVIVASPEKFRALHDQYDGQEIYSAHMAGGVSVYNPGAEGPNPEARETIFVNAELRNLEMSGRLFASVDLGKMVGAELEERDIRLAQASCNLLIDGGEPLVVDGDPGPKTRGCMRTVLGDDFSADDWEHNAQSVQTIVAHSHEAAAKGRILAQGVVDGAVVSGTRQAYEAQAFLRSQNPDAEFDGVVDDKTQMAARASLGKAPAIEYARSGQDPVDVPDRAGKKKVEGGKPLADLSVDFSSAHDGAEVQVAQVERAISSDADQLARPQVGAGSGSVSLGV